MPAVAFNRRATRDHGKKTARMATFRHYALLVPRAPALSLRVSRASREKQVVAYLVQLVHPEKQYPGKGKERGQRNRANPDPVYDRRGLVYDNASEET